MNTKTLVTFIVMLGLTVSVGADVIVQPITAIQTGGSDPHQSSMAATVNGAGLSSALNDGDAVPETMPTHSGNYQDGVRWIIPWGIPSALTFDLGGAQADPINSVILYNYNESGGSFDRGLKAVDVWTSTDGSNYSLFQSDLTFAETSVDGSNQTLAQAVDLASTIPAGVTHIQFRDLQSQGAADIIGFGEVRFAAIPEPATIGFLGFGAMSALFIRRRIMI